MWHFGKLNKANIAIKILNFGWKYVFLDFDGSIFCKTRLAITKWDPSSCSLFIIKKLLACADFWRAQLHLSYTSLRLFWNLWAATLTCISYCNNLNFASIWVPPFVIPANGATCRLTHLVNVKRMLTSQQNVNFIPLFAALFAQVCTFKVIFSCHFSLNYWSISLSQKWITLYFYHIPFLEG